MKKILLILMVISPCVAMAQSEVCESSFTVNTVTIASHTATLVDSASLALIGRKWVEVQNVSTDTVRCAHVAASATTSTGRMLAANGGAWSLDAASGDYTVTVATYSPHIASRSWTQSIKFYCITTGSDIVGKVVLSQCR